MPYLLLLDFALRRQIQLFRGSCAARRERRKKVQAQVHRDIPRHTESGETWTISTVFDSILYDSGMISARFYDMQANHFQSKYSILHV